MGEFDLALDGRVVLVTGGSSGVGLATVEDLLSAGANVVTCARDGDRLTAATGELAGSDRLLARPCDVRDADQVAGLVAVGIERFGRLDGVVNNAGQSLMRPFDQTAWDEWQAEFELKFSPVLNTVTAARPHLSASPGGGTVVNVNAVLARQPEPRLAATSAARAGLLNLTRTLAADLAAEQIRVNSVLLGLIDTGQWRRRFDEQKPVGPTGQPASWEEWQADLASDRGIGLGRLGTASEVSFVITMLSSPRASYVTGTSIDVAGGVGRYV